MCLVRPALLYLNMHVLKLFYQQINYYYHYYYTILCTSLLLIAPAQHQHSYSQCSKVLQLSGVGEDSTLFGIADSL